MSGTINSTNITRPVEEKSHLVGQLVTGKEADNYKMVTIGTLNHKSNVIEDLCRKNKSHLYLQPADKKLSWSFLWCAYMVFLDYSAYYQPKQLTTK